MRSKLFSHAQVCKPMDGRLPGSSIHGILQARILECVAIAFSNAWKSKVKMKSLSRVRLLATPWTAAYQAPPSIGFSRQEYWSRVPLPSPAPEPIKIVQYEDDILLLTDTEEQCDQATCDLLHYLAQCSSKISKYKAQIRQWELKYLGFKLSQGVQSLGK